MSEHPCAFDRSGRASLLRLIATLAIGASLACGGSNRIPGIDPPPLRPRAAFDLNCPEKSITLIKIDEKTTGARGCGKQATYVESCQGTPSGNETNCQWLMNSTATQAPQPSPAPYETPK